MNMHILETLAYNFLVKNLVNPDIGPIQH